MSAVVSDEVSSLRTTLLNDLAAMIANVESARPIRVAIDGRTASGKTTLANELASCLAAKGRDVIRTSIDGFHRPRVERYARGRHSAEGYYYDARDLPAINALLLSPLGPGGDRWYRTASFDLDNDFPVEQAPQFASADAILIVDGTFLQRPELRDGWDLTVFVETTERVSEQRGIDRDAAHLGGTEATRQLYADRYRPAFDLYQRLCAPASAADVIFNNDNFEQPALRVRGDGRLSAVSRNL
ncbi:uridylate kinase [Agrobacterium rhizogenes]|nr:uridylate kinase [Rhizobium rhizogenes]NTG61902.1 uridylate kinase [Rhizobium rhizogenes]NTG81364.1 uridylate kinase [Rhizobium rhizogenes]NTH65497.1 uridylate kinase [Rhizobium rhizogenes]NTH97106.1 uridylate kinase [Rhizobium rhizogenes]